MCDNDKQLILRTPNQSKSLYDGNGDVDNDPGNLVQRKPKPHSQGVTRTHKEKDHTMLSPNSQKKSKSLKPKMTFDDQVVAPLANHAKLKYQWNEYRMGAILFYFLRRITNKTNRRPY